MDTGLHVETQSQLNAMHSVLTGIEKKVNSLKAQLTPRMDLRSDTMLPDEVKRLADKMDKMATTLNAATSEITKGQQKRKKEIVAEVSAAVKAHNETNMCFYSSVVGHHPSVSPHSNSSQAMIVILMTKEM